MEAKLRAKVESREKNLHPGDLRLSESTLRNLDGSVKKNTAFQRKLVGCVVFLLKLLWILVHSQRSVTEQQRAAMTSDLKALNLSKYLQEVVSYYGWIQFGSMVGLNQ